MLLPGALFALFAVGFWLYCLVDVALTPSDECRRLPKAAWVVVVAATFVVGAVVWLAVRQPAQPGTRHPGSDLTGPGLAGPAGPPPAGPGRPGDEPGLLASGAQLSPA